jgi:hypothetical protein
MTDAGFSPVLQRWRDQSASSLGGDAIVHLHRWRIHKYGVRAYDDGRRRTVLFLVCETCGHERTKSIARRELSWRQLNHFADKHYHQETHFTGRGSDRPSGHT